jgi:hypothetical protein
MPTTALTTRFSAGLLAAALTLAAGILQPLLAGPEPFRGNDKEVEIVPAACDPRWYISVGGGVDIDTGSEFSNGVHSVDEPLMGITTDLRVKSRNYNDVYKDWYQVRAEVGYAITQHLEVFGTFNYTQADAQTITGSKLVISSPLIPITGQIGFDFVSHFDDYQSYGGELGLRYYFLAKEARIRPYISLSGGATWVDAIGLHATTDFLGFGFTVYDGPFYNDSVVGTGRALFGLEFAVIPCRFAVGVDAGVKYSSSLEGDDSGFQSNSTTSGLAAFAHERLQTNGSSGGIQSAFLSMLRPLNDNGAERWSIPVSVYAKFRF